MASTVDEGQNNPAFVASLDDEVSIQRPPPGEAKEAFQEEEVESRCQLLGLIPLPASFQRLFVSASWILVFLSLASTIQVCV